MTKRASGLLLPITSLPSKYGIGDLGPEAYRFADICRQAGQRYWQLLPLNCPAIEIPHSPYYPMSAFAQDALLISPDLLYRQGLLSKKHIRQIPHMPQGTVNYHRVIAYKNRLFSTAYENFKRSSGKEPYLRFCVQNKSWLNDYALYTALREHFKGRLWCDWPCKYRDRQKTALRSAEHIFRDTIAYRKFLQYQFFKQYLALKKYCSRQNIRIIGDIGLYLAYDSSDVWANPKFFKLNAAKKPRFVSGVPPDYFSQTGQLWGNPVYNWSALSKEGYSWWIQRLKHNLTLFDMVRIDHFRGLVAYWQVPAEHETAEHGKWVRAAGRDFFTKLVRLFSPQAFIVEDLGYITPAVRAVVNKFKLSGMKVLQFGFDGDLSRNCHCPDNYTPDSVVYTGTHDNNTARGWFQKEATPQQKKALFTYLGHRAALRDIHWEFVRLALSSLSRLAIIPVQDVIGLGAQARINHPATTEGNWTWRLKPGQITKPVINKLAKLTQTCSRA